MAEEGALTTPGSRIPEPRWLFYTLSLLIPTAGVVISALFLTKDAEEQREFGKNCLIMSLITIAIILLLYLTYIFFVVAYIVVIIIVMVAMGGMGAAGI